MTMPQPNAPAPFTPDLRGLIAWLETVPEDESYDEDDECKCVFGQFFSAINQKPVYYLHKITRVYPKADTIAFDKPHTFGAALSRARAALSESEK